MKKKILFLLALTSLSFAGMKHYDVTFGAPAVLGSTAGGKRAVSVEL